MGSIGGDAAPPANAAPGGSREALLASAGNAAARGDWAAAEEPVRSLLRFADVSLPELDLGARVLLARDHYRDARSAVLRMADRSPRRAVELLTAVRWLRRFEESERLAHLVSGFAPDDLHEPHAMAELALHLSGIGEFEAAQSWVERMLRAAPRSPDAHYLLGLLEMFAGRAEASLAALGRALALEPRMANAHWLVAMQDGSERADAHVEMMRRVQGSIRPGSEAQAYLFYALHHRLHALGRHDEAWAALDRGMKVQRALEPFDAERSLALFQSLKRMPLPGAATGTAQPGGTGLIFIVGMFRSGTTLIETILGRHPDVADGGETYQVSAGLRDAADHDCVGVIDQTIVARAPSLDLQRVRERMLAYAAWRGRGRGWLTEKLPSNFLNLGFILQALPEAKVIHLRRNAADTCFSNLRTIFRGAAPYACNPLDMADYFRDYLDLMEHWHSIAPGRILDVRYEDLVADPEQQTRRLLAYCGLSPAGNLLGPGEENSHVATASAAHARQGILKGRGNAWKPYEHHLQAMLERLGTVA